MTRVLLDELGTFHNDRVYDTQYFKSLHQIALEANYLFKDDSAENKICIDVYKKKDRTCDVILDGSSVQPPREDITIFGYAIIYAYYNTKMFTTCYILLNRYEKYLEHYRCFQTRNKGKK